jgi:dCTP deaminase
MAVVTKGEIERRLRLSITDPQSLVITPLLRRKQIFSPSADGDSIDLRLGSHFLLHQIPPLPYTYPSKNSARWSHVRVQVSFGSYLVVPAHETVLGATLEFIKLPPDLSGEILTKSSVARTFIVIETAPWIHPSYRGCLTLEIANASNTPLILYPGRLIGQLVLLEHSPRMSTVQENKLSGSYLAPVYPEAPIFRDPFEDLKEIGVPHADMIRPEDRIKPRDKARRIMRRIRSQKTG